MPLYEYRCDACGYDGELLTGMGETRTTCPACGREGLQKKISGFSIGSKKSPACPSGGICPPAGSGGCCGGGCSHGH